MKIDVQRIYDRCITSRQVKPKVLPCDMYTFLLVLKEP